MNSKRVYIYRDKKKNTQLIFMKVAKPPTVLFKLPEQIRWVVFVVSKCSKQTKNDDLFEHMNEKWHDMVFYLNS